MAPLIDQFNKKFCQKKNYNTPNSKYKLAKYNPYKHMN